LPTGAAKENSLTDCLKFCSVLLLLNQELGGDCLITGNDKLLRDLEILTAMAGEMESYLNSNVLFWRMGISRMPALTLGGYLMRQHRLLALRNLLTAEQLAELDAAVFEYNKALVEKTVRFEQKAQRELDARLRQWDEYLKDVERGVATSTSNYSTAVETWAMVAAIVDQLQLAPYTLERRIPQQTALLDNQLRRLWEPGEFIWPDEWQPAYPETDYWWLYGKPRDKRRP
jgi:hypothetical protein